MSRAKEADKVKKARIILAGCGVLLLALVGFMLWGKQKFVPENVTFAILPDTQLYAQSMPQIFEAQTRWIAENAEKEGIDFVLHVGDIVNNPFHPQQWESAVAAMDWLDQAQIPYAVATGNHDVDYKAAHVEMDQYYDDMRPAHENFLHYFPREKFETMETYGGHSENGYNQYHFVPCGSGEILVLALDWRPSQQTLAWAETILQKYSDYPTVLLRHDFIRSREVQTEALEPAVLSGDESRKVWDVIKKYDQVFLTVNGHLSVEHGMLQNDAGHDVLAVMVDFQNEFRGGNGWMSMLKLDFDNDTIAVNSFSPYVMTIPEAERGEKDLAELHDPLYEYQVPFPLTERFQMITG